MTKFSFYVHNYDVRSNLRFQTVSRNIMPQGIVVELAMQDQGHRYCHRYSKCER